MPVRLPGWLAIGAAWALYLPLGWQYLFFLAGGALALAQLTRGRQLSALPRQPLFLLVLVFWGWMLLSAAWSSATPDEVGAHLWHYALPLLMAPLALVMQPHDARQALRHFVAASAVVALLLPLLLSDRITGNQRIEYSLLLALAAAFALIEGFAPALRRHARAPWLGCAAICIAGVALQDRRTGMLVLPLLLMAWVLARQRHWGRRLLLLALLGLAVLLAWQGSPMVRERFAQGVAELQQYRSQGPVETSLGMRLRMLESSGEMVRERPWFGHGVGAWRGLWERQGHRGELLQAHTTPHNEYLLIAVQGGAVALLLFLVALAGHGVAAWRSAGKGHVQALLVWVGFAFAALFNVALRDAKLALPLLMLGVLAWAAARPPRP